MNDNMPILWQNALLQFRTEIARKAWIWFAETRGAGMHYKTDKFACEVDQLVLSCSALIGMANKAHNASDEVCSDITAFILRRHANLRLGGNVKPTYC
jgi:hypothetical protein